MPPEVGLEPMTPLTLEGHSNHLSYPGGPVLTTTYRLNYTQMPVSGPVGGDQDQLLPEIKMHCRVNNNKLII